MSAPCISLTETWSTILTNARPAYYRRPILFLWVAVFLSIVFFCINANADWAEAEDSKVIGAKPGNGSSVLQNPPAFTWRRSRGASGYELAIRRQGSNDQIQQVRRNWFLPDAQLKTGEYSWTVRPTGVAGQWSSERRFIVPPEAIKFVVANDDELLKGIRARSRPRSLPVGSQGAGAWAVRMHVEKALIIQNLAQQVRAYAAKPLVDEQTVLLVPRTTDEQAWVASLDTIRVRTLAEARQVRAAALLWRLTGERFYMDEAVRRGNALAALNPAGSTSHANQDQGNRAIAWGLSSAFDYLAADLNKVSQILWLVSIRIRTAAIFAGFKQTGWRLEDQPLDSHGATNLAYFITISSLMIDSIAEAEDWFRDAFRFYVKYESPWGRADGGFANGTAYAEYAIYYLVDLWDAIAATTRVNMYEKPWARGLLRSFACFAPPGTPSHVFGDAAERRPSGATLKGYANRYGDDLAMWYSRNLLGEEDALSALTNPLPTSSSNGARALPDFNANACLDEHIGWAAMHSDLKSRSRTSLYFKSSPYGAFNHSHGDQNSFTLVSGGRPLLTDSGWYDWYGSPLWTDWYRQTKAHNAVTFDAGQGQMVDDADAPKLLRAGGHITAFSATQAIDFVEGDATFAYGGALTSAIRRVWYVRAEDAVVIWDKLVSPVDRLFEWNLHAPTPIMDGTGGMVTIRNREQTLCITPLLQDGIQFQRRVGAPSRPDIFEDHGFFAIQQARRAAEFLFLLDVGCKRPSVALRSLTTGRELQVGGALINLPD